MVLLYEKTELKLIQLRDEDTGAYFNLDNHPLVKKYNVNRVKEETKPLKEILKDAETATEKEGWIVRLENGQFLKVKARWYLDRHGLLTQGLTRENLIASLILDEKLDDVLLMVGDKDSRRKYSLKIQKGLSEYLKNVIDSILEMLKDYNRDRKAFALKYKNEEYFPIAVLHLNDHEPVNIYKNLKGLIQKRTSSLSQARNFIEEKRRNY